MANHTIVTRLALEQYRDQCRTLQNLAQERVEAAGKHEYKLYAVAAREADYWKHLADAAQDALEDLYQIPSRGGRT